MLSEKVLMNIKDWQFLEEKDSVFNEICNFAERVANDICRSHAESTDGAYGVKITNIDGGKISLNWKMLIKKHGKINVSVEEHILAEVINALISQQKFASTSLETEVRHEIETDMMRVEVDIKNLELKK